MYVAGYYSTVPVFTCHYSSNSSSGTITFRITAAIVGIYFESFNFAKFSISNTIAKIKASTHFDPHIFYVSPVVDTIIKNDEYFSDSKIDVIHKYFFS